MASLQGSPIYDHYKLLAVEYHAANNANLDSKISSRDIKLTNSSSIYLMACQYWHTWKDHTGAVSTDWQKKTTHFGKV